MEKGKIQMWVYLFFLSGFIVPSTAQDCPTRQSFLDGLPDWPNANEVLDIVNMTNHLPGWSILIQGLPVEVLDSPDITEVGNIVEDETLSFTLLHRGNTCVTTSVEGMVDSGDLVIQSAQQVGPNTYEIQYLFTPDVPGTVDMYFDLNEIGGPPLRSAILSVYVKSLYDLTVQLGDGTTGTPGMSDTYVEGEDVAYTYSYETCYENLQVTLDGVSVPSEGTIHMDSAKSLITTADFIENTVTVASTSGGSTDKDGANIIPCDGSIEITPTASTCFRFVQWSGDASGSVVPLQLDHILQNMDITAEFEALEYPVQVTSSTGGMVTMSCSDPIACGESCTFEALPDPCYEFTGWSGDLTGTTNPATLDGISSAVNISADFALKHFDVTVSSTTGGTTDSDGTTSVECGTFLTVTATPDSGYRFIGWSGDASGTLNPLSFTDIQSDLNITANFEPDVYTVSVFSTIGGGTDMDGMNTVLSGGSLTITATPIPCYVFAGWSGDVGGTANPLTVTGITRDMDITANFTKLTQIVHVTSTSGGFTDHEGSTVVNCNDDVLITAFPELGYTFLGWSGDATGTANPLTLAGVVEDLDLTAHFSPPDPRPPVLDYHDLLTNLGTMSFTGTAMSLEVEVSAPTGVVTVPVTGNTFSTNVPLLPNRKNTVFFTSVSGSQRSAPTATTITHDGTPPVLTIQFPENGSTLTTPSTDVAGSVGDLLSGFQGLSVTVNGTPAVVDIGIGTNGSFFAEGVPLNPDSSTLIEATATDSLGNSMTRTITLFHEEVAADAPVMTIVSGNGQTGQVQAMLTDPIEVQVTHGDGSPFANKIVTFTVVRSDGLLSPDAMTSGTRSLQIRTDANGNALAYWQVGMDAGCGNNRIKVTSTSIAGTVFFCASADPAPAAQINIGTGNNQRLEVNAPACEPLIAWVNDGCNGVNGIPVTFRAGKGGGLVNGLKQVTVNTGETGHAQVNYTMGPSAGTQTIVADFPGNPGAPVVFMAFGVARDVSLPTTFSGLVIDNAGRPIGGAACSLTVNGMAVPTTNTNADGIFSFSGVPDGPGELAVDGKVATALNGSPIPNGSFPGLHFPVVVVPNAENSLPTPVKLPRMNPTNEVAFDNTTDVTLSVEEIDGLEMRVKAGSMRLADGSIPSPSTPVMLSLNPVHVEDIPMPMPDGATPPFAWTLQPGGATFNPPVEISYPNMSGLAPGALAFFLSFNHDTNSFEIVSTATVTEDGGTIETDEGMGLSVAGWGGICPPYTVTGGVCFGSPSNCVDEGELTEGVLTVSNATPNCGDLITFSVADVLDSGGSRDVGCPGFSQTETIDPGTIQYQFEVLHPSGAVETGEGNTALVLASEPGIYTCRFTASSIRACAPADFLVGEISADVQEPCSDCFVHIFPEGNTTVPYGSTLTFRAVGGPGSGTLNWDIPGGLPSTGIGTTFSTTFIEPNSIQTVSATWTPNSGGMCTDSLDIAVDDVEIELIGADSQPLEHAMVATWENAFEFTPNPVLKSSFELFDEDRFVVRIHDPVLAGAIEISATLRTIDHEGDIADSIENISLGETFPGSGIFESTPLILTSNDVDDVYPIGSVADGEPQDVTINIFDQNKVSNNPLSARVGGSVRVDYFPALGHGPAGIELSDNFNVSPICSAGNIGKVFVRVVVFVDEGTGDPIVSFEDIKRDIAKMNENFAHCCIYFEIFELIEAITPVSEQFQDYGLDGQPSTNDDGENDGSFSFVDISCNGLHDAIEPSEPFSDINGNGYYDQLVDFSDGLDSTLIKNCRGFFEPNGEGRYIVSTYSDQDPQTLDVFYVPKFSTNIKGQAWLFESPEFTNVMFFSVLNRPDAPFTLPHEGYHLLSRRSHDPSLTNLMYDGTSSQDVIEATKRLRRRHGVGNCNAALLGGSGLIFWE